MSGRHRWIEEKRRLPHFGWARLYPDVARYWRALHPLFQYKWKCCVKCGARCVNYQPAPNTRNGEWRQAFRDPLSFRWRQAPPTPGCRGLPDDYDPPLGG